MSNLIFHVLHNYAPSNLNRGKDGSPKTADFGGVRRGRISSQSLKRALRTGSTFEKFADRDLLDIRTREMPLLIAEELRRRGQPDPVVAEITGRLQELGRQEKQAAEEKQDDKPSKEELITNSTKQLVTLNPTAIKQLTDQLLDLRAGDKWDKNLEKQIKPIHVYGVNTALFGAMTTSAAFVNLEAACQVGQAISVNQVRWQVDYFTAVDDLSGETGMIGEAPFNSNTYYWALAVSVDKLLENLRGDIDLLKEVLAAFTEGLLFSHPSGKQSTNLAKPPISLLLVEAKDTVMDYSNAFEKPVAPTEDHSLVENAILALSDYIKRVDALYNLPAQRVHVALNPVQIPGSTQLPGRKELIEWVTA